MASCKKPQSEPFIPSPHQHDQMDRQMGKAYRVYRSLQTESPEPVEVCMKGEVPTWIEGCLLRNGPGKFELGEQKMNHFFDGLSVLHRFDISNGKVTYQNRFQRSDAFILGMEKNRVILSEFGTIAYPDPCLNIFQRFMARFTANKDTDNYNVNVYQIGEEFFVCSEMSAIRKIDPNTLETLDKIEMPKILALNSATAHPHSSPEGVVYNMGSTFGKVTLYNIVQVTPRTDQKDDTFQNASIVASIPNTLHNIFPSYYHSFGMTSDYFVFLEMPLLVNIFKILKAKVLNQSSGPALEFHDEKKAKFHLIHRETGNIVPITYETDALVSFHHINAYEEDGHVIVDLVCYPDAEVLGNMNMDDVRSGYTTSNAQARRYVLPLDVEGREIGSNLNGLSYSKAECLLQEDVVIRCKHEIICDRGVEMPKINYDLCNGKPYRYFYAVATQERGVLVKGDTRDGTCIKWQEDFCWPSEPVFVGRPGSTTEDDGVILSAVIDVREGHASYLLILDARNLEEIGRAEVPVQIPVGFHGMFVTRGNNI